MLSVNVRNHTNSIIARCKQSKDSLLQNNRKKNKNRYLFIPCKGTPQALGVAHVDTVFEGLPRFNGQSLKLDPPKVLPGGDIRSGALDDRLGVSILMDILPKVMPSFKYDILLTDDEEIGRSTASDFVNDCMSNDSMYERTDNYRFLFQFDRAGCDVVTYNYYNRSAEAYLEDSCWHIGHGSFSDISAMEDLGIWAANFGCGYHNQHSNDCYVDMDQLDMNLRRFAMFVKRTGNTIFKHSSTYNSNFSSSNKWRNGYYGESFYSKSNKGTKYGFYEQPKSTFVDSKTKDPFYAADDWSSSWETYVDEDAKSEDELVDMFVPKNYFKELSDEADEDFETIDFEIIDKATKSCS